MKNLFIAAILGCVIFNSFSVYSEASINNNSNTNIEITEINERIIVSKSAKYEMTKQNHADLPETYSYTYYDEEFGTVMSGTLYLRKTERLASGWYKGYYEGTVTGNI